MIKIPSLYLRDFDGEPRYITREVNPVCQWVIDGEGVATEKHDGTACMWRDGLLWARFDRKRGKPGPDGWEACQPEPDPNTGHWPGWVPVGDEPQFKWHREALANAAIIVGNGTTLELVGPKVQANPYGLTEHTFFVHGSVPLIVPTDFDALRAWLSEHAIEGVVWHHPDGRMAKIKARDFGIAWPRAKR